MNKQNLERLVYFLIVLLSALALALVAHSHFFELDTKVVYQGF